MKEQNLINEENSGFTIQEASKKLSLPENTLRKYIVYFELKVEKSGRKSYLVNESMECLTQIIQLKSNGWSLKQIKDFMNKEGKNKAEALGSSNEAIESGENISNDSAEEITENSQIEVNDSEGEGNIGEEETEADENDDYAPEVSSIEVESEFVEEIDPNLPTQGLDNSGSFDERNEEDQIEKPTKTLLREDELDASNISEVNEDEQNEEQEDQFSDSSDESRSSFSKRVNLTKDSVNKEIANQAKRASRLYRFLGSRNSPRDTAEIKADLDRRVIFLNGLRYIRDNWLERPSHEGTKEKALSGAN